MNIASQLAEVQSTLPQGVRIVAVSKLRTVSEIQEAYDAGQRLFGENRVQELLPKYENLPQDIEWHFIGHLQINKVKLLAPFIAVVHSVDRLRLLEELNRQAKKNGRRIRVLLQIHIAQEEHKFGFSFDAIEELLQSNLRERFPHLQLCGLMGMATFTDDEEQIRQEFAGLYAFFEKMRKLYFAGDKDFREVSMGMSDDYPLAVEESSTLIRIGAKLFNSTDSPGKG